MLGARQAQVVGRRQTAAAETTPRTTRSAAQDPVTHEMRVGCFARRTIVHTTPNKQTK